MDKYDVMLTSGILIKHAPKMNFHFLTLICSLIQLLGMLCFYSWMASVAIIRSECHPKMWPKQPFEILLVTFITPPCPSVSKMPELHIKGLWPQSFITWCTKRSRTMWMTFLWSQKPEEIILLSYERFLKGVNFTSFAWIHSNVLLELRLGNFWDFLYIKEV